MQVLKTLQIRFMALSMVLAVVICGLFASQARAETPPEVKATKVTRGLIFNYGGILPVREVGLFGFELADGTALEAYCIEVNNLATAPIGTVGGRVVSWDEFRGTNKFRTDESIRPKVAWIARNSYPAISLEDLVAASGVTGLTDVEAMSGTQAAIWTLTDDVTPLGIVGNAAPGAFDRVKALMGYLTGPANVGSAESYGEKPTVSVEAPASAEAGKLVGPFTIKTGPAGTKATVSVEPGLELVNANGEPVGKFVANGGQVYVKTTASSSGTITLKASVTGHAYTSALLDNSAFVLRFQTIIFTGTQKLSAEAEASVTLTSTPTPTPSVTTTPTPTPSVTPTPTPTPSVTPTPTPSVTPKSKPGPPKSGN